MDNIVNLNKCTGCSACYNVCPKHAIKMVRDEEGFLIPNIDNELCINCGLCKKKCPVINKKSNFSLNECYAGYSKRESIKKSSSGGIFGVIATYILKSNGAVIGACLENDELKHIVIEKKEDLNKVRGSKYLQSDISSVYKFIRNNIKEKLILFVGTPCQVAGIKSVFDSKYENLICIDLFCHGVPSLKVFEKYLNELEREHNDIVIGYDFRSKQESWENYKNVIYFKTKKIEMNYYDNPYMKLFLNNISLRKSCYNCNFKLGNKYSDLTLGDFWGIKSFHPDIYNSSGVSAVIVNTEKGLKILNKILDQCTFKKCSIREILTFNKSLKKSAPRNKKREKFFKKLNSMTIKEMSSKYCGNNKLSMYISNKIKLIEIKLINKNSN